MSVPVYNHNKIRTHIFINHRIQGNVLKHPVLCLSLFRISILAGQQQWSNHGFGPKTCSIYEHMCIQISLNVSYNISKMIGFSKP